MNIPLNIDWQQILLHLFNFVILAGGLYFILYKPVKNFMDKRSEYYKELDDKANSKLEDAQKLQKDYEERLSAVTQEISDKRRSAEERIKRYTDNETARANAEASRIVSDAKQKAEEESRKLMKSAQDEMLSISIAAARKISGESVNAEKGKELFEELLQKVGETNVQ